MESRPKKNVYCLRLIYFCVFLVSFSFSVAKLHANERTSSLFNVYRIHFDIGNLNAKVEHTFMKSAQVADCQPLLFGMCTLHTSSWNHLSKINLYCVWFGGLGNFNDVRYIDNARLCSMYSFVLKWCVTFEIIEIHVRLIQTFLSHICKHSVLHRVIRTLIVLVRFCRHVFSMAHKSERVKHLTDAKFLDRPGGFII